METVLLAAWPTEHLLVEERVLYAGSAVLGSPAREGLTNLLLAGGMGANKRRRAVRRDGLIELLLSYVSLQRYRRGGRYWIVGYYRWPGENGRLA